MQVYIVGGHVRDTLLGLKPNDLDLLVVGATLEQVLKEGVHFRGVHYQNLVEVGADFPILFHKETETQIAFAKRSRVVSDCFHVDPTVTLEEDLNRRDLTINALAMDENGVITDLHGGQKDLEQKRLRRVSDLFSEDPLRVLRMLRMREQLPGQWTIDPETEQYCKRLIRSKALDNVAVERLSNELARMSEKPNFVQTLLELLVDYHAEERSMWFCLRKFNLVKLKELANYSRTDELNDWIASSVDHLEIFLGMVSNGVNPVYQKEQKYSNLFDRTSKLSSWVMSNFSELRRYDKLEPVAQHKLIKALPANHMNELEFTLIQKCAEFFYSTDQWPHVVPLTRLWSDRQRLKGLKMGEVLKHRGLDNPKTPEQFAQIKLTVYLAEVEALMRKRS